jgi:4-hydroxy-tetrahydrodipicolinate synthase
LAETIFNIGSEHVRLPRKPLSGTERDEVLKIINTGIKNRPDLSKYNF